MPDDPRRERIGRWGRRLALAAFAALVAGSTAHWSIQILRQVWAPPSGPVAGSCREGIADLLSALNRAKIAAAQEGGGERIALSRFRETLRPEWEQRPGLNVACRSDPPALQALSRIDALRYAEEHAVRYEAVSLAEQRRRVDAITRELLDRSSQ